MKRWMIICPRRWTPMRYDNVREYMRHFILNDNEKNEAIVFARLKDEQIQLTWNDGRDRL